MSNVSRLYLKQIEVGPMQNYAYIVGDRETHEAVLIDAAWDIDGLISIAEQDDMKITAGLVTHFHPDHLGGSMMGMDIIGAAELVGKHPMKIYLHKSEGSYAQKVSGLSASDMVLTEGGDDITVGEIPIKFLHTPGHTPGHVSFLLERDGGLLFVGDAAVAKNGEVKRGYMNRAEPTFDASLRHIADFDFERAVFGHAAPLLSGASAAFSRFVASIG